MQAGRTAATGLRAQQERLDTIAANIANVNTTGYKSARADFKDALYTQMINAADGLSTEHNLLRGTGVVLNATGRDFSGGAMQTTGGKLDFSLSGEGFFMLEGNAGERLYTRDGSFTVSEENGNSYLVSADGHYVLSGQGTRIQLPGNGAVSVDGSGILSYEGQPFSNLAVMQFSNPEGLRAVGNSCFSATGASGNAYATRNTEVLQGSLEGSNVDLGQEMALLIRTQRVYSMAGKALQTADEMDGLANNMR